MKQWRSLVQYSSGMEVWLGGLASPEAYITATRQAAAHAANASLEQLTLQV
jgi:dynein heavy chain 1